MLKVLRRFGVEELLVHHHLLIIYSPFKFLFEFFSTQHFYLTQTKRGSILIISVCLKLFSTLIYELEIKRFSRVLVSVLPLITFTITSTIYSRVVNIFCSLFFTQIFAKQIVGFEVVNGVFVLDFSKLSHFLHPICMSLFVQIYSVLKRAFVEVSLFVGGAVDILAEIRNVLSFQGLVVVSEESDGWAVFHFSTKIIDIR